MDNGFIEDGWKPQPLPEKGSNRWKDDIAFCMALRALPNGFPQYSVVIEMPEFEGHKIGYFCINRRNGGWDYFRSEILLRFAP